MLLYVYFHVTNVHGLETPREQHAILYGFYFHSALRGHSMLILAVQAVYFIAVYFITFIAYHDS